jgi:hypothetical protein
VEFSAAPAVQLPVLDFFEQDRPARLAEGARCAQYLSGGEITTTFRE